MTFNKLLAIFILYHHNFRVLHWQTKDLYFNEYHELCGDYYEHLQDDLDSIAEMGITYDEMPLTLEEAMDLLKKDDDNFKIVEAHDTYEAKDIVENIDIMFKDILKNVKDLIKTDKVDENPGVRSNLEAIYAYYDKELNYKNKRRKSN